MHIRSLRARLVGLWLLTLVSGLGVAALLFAMYRQSTKAQVGRDEAVIARDCDLIRDRYEFVLAGWAGIPPNLADSAIRKDLAVAAGLALRTQDGVEGGIWETAMGPLAYAFPTYEGGLKTDLPSAERNQIETINGVAARNGQSVGVRSARAHETVLLHACPLPGPDANLTAWTMTRVGAARGEGSLFGGLGVLLALLLGMAIWLGRTLLVWSRHVRAIETALAQAGPHGLPEIRPTGEGELDRIVEALNDASRRLTAARAEADQMASRAAEAERLAALGRVAAGIAHEIRNPIAAARLQGENGLAGDDARRARTIAEMLDQLERLDLLVSELLAMTQRATPTPVRVELAAFLAECLRPHEAFAKRQSVHLRSCGAAGTATLDPTMVRRILDNLLVNALRHTPRDGCVTLRAERHEARLTIVAEDSGSGVASDIAGRLFEPFATGRADGTGLGLAIARQIAEAHGGSLVLRRVGGVTPGQGACFALELPCPAS